MQRVPSKRSRTARAPVITVRLSRADHRAQEGGRGAVADAVPDRQLGEADAVELGAVVVVVERDAGLLRGRDGGRR